MRLFKALYGTNTSPKLALTTYQALRARRRWKSAILFVLRLVRKRRLWARLGGELKFTAKLFDHVERKKGVLVYKK